MKAYSCMFLFLLILAISPVVVHSQTDYPWLRSGDELYRHNAYSDAETAYRKAEGEKPQATTTYNLGNSIYRQERIPEAIKAYQQTIQNTNDPSLKADAWYNLGNAHYQNQDYPQSIKAYKEALKLRPEDMDAKKNLMMAMQQLQQQQNQQQEQQQQDNEQEPPQQDQNQPQQPQDQQPPSEQEPQGDKPSSSTPEDVSEEEAREILKAVEREDQRVQEKMKKSPSKSAPPVKDW